MTATAPEATAGDSTAPAAPVGRTIGIARPAAGRLALATLLGAGAVGAAIGLMGTSAWLLSRAAQHPSESALALGIVGVQFFGLSRGFLRYGERLVGHDAAFRLLARLRVRLYQRLEQLAPAGLPAFRSGDLLARVVADIDSLQELILRVLPPFAVAALVGAATVGLVWWLLPAAGLILLVALLMAATLVPWLTGVLTRHHEARDAGARGELAASVIDLIDGAPELTAFGATGAQLQRIGGTDTELTAIASRAAATSGVGLGLTTLLAGLASWGSLVVGVRAVHAGRLHGVLLAVIVLVPLSAFELVAGLPVATQSLQRARRSARGCSPSPRPRCRYANPTRRIRSPRPFDVRARAVRARYPGAAGQALGGIDLDLAHGRRLAVVGPSGAGKSTLASVLVRFLAYEAGSVTLTGTELDRLGGEAARTVVGLVGQDAHLFDTSLAANLRIARRDATDAELRATLDQVGLGAWLHGLPGGLGTEVGRRGRVCPGASASGWPSLGRCWLRSPCWCSTSPRSTSTGPPPTRSPQTCSR